MIAIRLVTTDCSDNDAETLKTFIWKYGFHSVHVACTLNIEHAIVKIWKIGIGLWKKGTLKLKTIPSCQVFPVYLLICPNAPIDSYRRGSVNVQWMVYN